MSEEKKAETSEKAKKHFPVREPEKAVESRRTLTLRFTEDGKVDWSSFSEKTRDRIKEILADPETVQALGIETGKSEAAPEFALELLDPETLSELLDDLGTFEAWAFSRIFKIPVKDAEEICVYTTDQKARLTGPAQRVANKYLPEFLLRYHDELALAFILGRGFAHHVKLSKQLSFELRAKEAETREPSPKPLDQADGFAAPRETYAQ
jgi:hypothetical protein